MNAASFEFRKFGTFRKKIGERLPDIPKRAFWSALCHVRHPRKRRALDGVELRFEAERGRIAAGATLRLPFMQRPIIDEPRRAAGFLEIRDLRRRGHQPDFVR